MPQKQPHDLCITVAVPRGREQRCEPCRVFRIRVGALGQQQTRRFGIIRKCRCFEHTESALITRLDVGAFLNHEPDDFGRAIVERGD